MNLKQIELNYQIQNFNLTWEILTRRAGEAMELFKASKYSDEVQYGRYLAFQEVKKLMEGQVIKR